MDLSAARHAFITGGASGLGLGIADALASRGVAVTLADVDAETLGTVLAQRPEGYRGQHLDTRDRTGWAAAKVSAEAEFGPVDILVNNAGIAPDGKALADMDPASFDRIIAINLTGVFNGVSVFAADMRARGHGHIVNTASMAGLVAEHPTIGGYNASKFAVVALSEVLRREMAPSGVGVSVLCPGLVPTNLSQSTQKVGGSVRMASGDMGSDGVTIDDVAALVLDGITRDLPYIITHKHRWPGVERRFEGLREAFGA